MFPPARPLSTRFGSEFFRSIPKEPGVYLMEDGRGKIVYVGKAKNLRNRLSSYRYLNPERASRKSIRLIHSVEKISWQLCESDRDAQLRENFLLRTHQPKFNTVNVYPKAYCFIGFRYSETLLELRFLRNEEVGFQLFGAFKTGAIFGYAALLRLLWATSKSSFALSHFPLRMLGSKPPRDFQIVVEPEVAAAVSAFLEGSHNRLSEWIAKFKAEELTTFETNLLASDAETLESFFQTATSKNRLLKHAFDVQTQVIPQEQLNDLLVQARCSLLQSIKTL